MRVIFVLLLLISPCLCSGQFIEQRLLNVTADPLNSRIKSTINILSADLISSVCIKTGSAENFGDAFIVSATDTFRLSRNEDISEQDSLTSNLVIFPRPVYQMTISPGSIRGIATLFLIKADFANLSQGPEPISVLKSFDQNLKTIPGMIDQSVWRQGLPAPDYLRISNTGTLGICVLGTYTEESPTDTSMRSLEKLIVWKLAKDHLDPLGVTPHRLNPDLDVISGHRNGCATLCPGDSLYADLFILRNRVHEAMLLLNTKPQENGASQDTGPMIRIYPNPADAYITIESSDQIIGIRVMDAFGRLVMNRNGNSLFLEVSSLSPGWYQIVVTLPDRNCSQKFIKL